MMRVRLFSLLQYRRKYSFFHFCAFFYVHSFWKSLLCSHVTIVVLVAGKNYLIFKNPITAAIPELDLYFVPYENYHMTVTMFFVRL